MSVFTEAVRPSDCGMGLELDAVGLNLAAPMPIADYDRAVPDGWTSQHLLATARSAIVIGAGGRSLSRNRRARGPEASLDTFVAQAIVRGCERLRERGWAAISFPYDDTRDGQHVDLIALARGAGLGAASRLGLLLHPEYGPWLSLRALVLTEKPPPESPPRRDFSPCEGCSAPCTDACPVDAPRALPAGFDISACTNRRALGGSCQLHCAARRACIFGSEHAYDLDTEERHMRASLSHIRPGVE